MSEETAQPKSMIEELAKEPRTDCPVCEFPVRAEPECYAVCLRCGTILVTGKLPDCAAREATEPELVELRRRGTDLFQRSAEVRAIWEGADSSSTEGRDRTINRIAAQLPAVVDRLL